MPKPLPRSITGKEPNLDKQKLESARRLAELAGPHLEECVDIVLEVARDKKSRQRLTAVSMLAEFATAGELAAAHSGDASRVQIIIAPGQVDEVERLQRQAEERKRLAARDVIDAEVVR